MYRNNNIVYGRGLVSQAGFGLPMALFVITVLALIIASMSQIQNDSSSSVSLQVNSFKNAYNTQATGIQAILFYNTTPLPTACDSSSKGKIYLGYTTNTPPSTISLFGCLDASQSYNVTYDWS